MMDESKNRHLQGMGFLPYRNIIDLLTDTVIYFPELLLYRNQKMWVAPECIG